RGAQADSPRAPGTTGNAHAATGQPAAGPRASGTNGEHPATDGADPFMAGVRHGTLTADELLQGYCAHVQGQTGNYEETARRLQLNWKTVRAKISAWTQRTPTNADEWLRRPR